MSPPPGRSARLLHADEEQLDRAAITLGSGTAFVVVICAAELRRAALERLRGKVTGLSLPEAVEVGSAEEMLDALVAQVERRDRVLSLALGSDATGALDGLNLHREKVLRGAPVIVWLDDVDALVRLRERAPDAFSFRSTMAIVRGDGGPLPVPRAADVEDVARARKLLKRAKTLPQRAMAGLHLAEQLRVRNRYDEAESEARATLGALAAADTEELRIVRVGLCTTLAAIASVKGMRALEFHWATRALAENANVSAAAGVNLEARLRSTFPGALAGWDSASVRKGLEMVRSYGLGPEVRAQALRAAAHIAVVVGDLQAARAHLREWRLIAGHVAPIDRARVPSDLAGIDRVAGDLASAEVHYREGAEAMVAEGGSPGAALSALGACLFERGEIDAAQSVAAELDSGTDLAHTWRPLNAFIPLERGDIVSSLTALREAAHEAGVRSQDAYLMNVLADLMHIVERGAEAERVSSMDLDLVRAELERGEVIVLALTAADGNLWYPSTFLSLRARLLSLSDDTLPQALSLSRRALAFAETFYADLVPEAGRALADVLLRIGQPDEALAVIARIEPAAASYGFLKERALLLADRVLALVQLGDAPASVEPHLAALREALAATDAPRLAAETLRDLAKRLPPTATTPDPHALAEEALGLFVVMPMPAQEARCLEIMGDVVLARGRSAEAKRRYLAARARLDRYGLGLRLPLLNRKIDALS